MEAGKLVQLLSLLNFGLSTEDDLQAWKDSNRAVIGDYHGPIDFPWALEKLSDLLNDEESREEVLEAISISAQFDNSGEISASSVCTRLADLLGTSDSGLQVRVVKCFSSIVKEDANRLKVARVAGMQLFNLNRSSNIEIAQISREITHELFQNAQALEFLTNSLEKVNRTDLDNMAAQVEVSRTIPATSDIPLTPSGKSNPIDVEKVSGKKKDGLNRNYVDAIGKAAIGKLSSALDMTGSAAQHFRKNVFPAGLEIPTGSSPDSSATLSSTPVEKKIESIWWTDMVVGSPQKSRSGSLSTRGSGLLVSSKDATEKMDSDNANVCCSE